MDLREEIAQVKCLLYGRITPAYNRYLLIAIKKSITRRAGTDAFPHEGSLGWQPKILSRSTGGDDQRVACVILRATDLERFLRQVNVFDVVKQDASLKPLYVLLHLLHELRSLQVVGAAWPVLDFGGRRQLSALL